MLRQQFLAWYRQWLLTDKKPERPLTEESDKLLNGPNTLSRALSYKYLGALAAVRKDSALARKYFEYATEPIQNENDSTIGIIKLTIFAEAYRSLNDETFKSSGLKLAAKLFKTHPTPEDIVPWYKNLTGETSSAPFAQFWY